MTLGRKTGSTVTLAEYGERVEILGRILYNPTERVYKGMGFFPLPSSDPPEGWHDEWYVEDGKIKVRAVQDEPPEIHLLRKFSKGDLLEALQACGLYEQAKSIYLADVDLQIAWAGFLDIDMDHPATMKIMSQYPDLFSEENVHKLQWYLTFKEVPEEEPQGGEEE